MESDKENQRTIQCTNIRKQRNNQKVCENIRQNLERTSFKNSDHANDDIKSRWRLIKHVVTDGTNQILGMEKNGYIKREI